MKKIIILGIICIALIYIIGIIPVICLVGLYFLFFFVYRKKYYIRIFSGETGAGKTLLANHMAQKIIRRSKKYEKCGFQGMNVYSTFFMEGANRLRSDFYNYKYPKNSVLILDEAQIMFDSREMNKMIKDKISNKLKAQMSLHRHHKLDIWYITQSPREIDAQIRRYANELYTIDRTIFFRKFSFILKKLKIKANVVPILVIYKRWKDVNDYERWYNNVENLSPKSYGAVTRFAIISRKSYDTYNTEQDDSYYNSLNDMHQIAYQEEDRNKFIDTGIVT